MSSEFCYNMVFKIRDGISALNRADLDFWYFKLCFADFQLNQSCMQF